MARKKKFHTTFTAWLKVNEELYKECEKYVKKTLKKLGVVELSLNDDEFICNITYNEHLFSRVKRVFFSKGELMLETEHVCGYPIGCITASEACRIALAVEYITEKNTKK